jgi:hypothetical protein
MCESFGIRWARWTIFVSITVLTQTQANGNFWNSMFAVTLVSMALLEWLPKNREYPLMRN